MTSIAYRKEMRVLKTDEAVSDYEIAWLLQIVAPEITDLRRL